MRSACLVHDKTHTGLRQQRRLRLSPLVSGPGQGGSDPRRVCTTAYASLAFWAAQRPKRRGRSLPALDRGPPAAGRAPLPTGLFPKYMCSRRGEHRTDRLAIPAEIRALRRLRPSGTLQTTLQAVLSDPRSCSFRRSAGRSTRPLARVGAAAARPNRRPPGLRSAPRLRTASRIARERAPP